jgi:hypothetical protein
MTKVEMIAKQAIKIEEQKAKIKQQAQTIKTIVRHCTAMGQPLNDNILGFDQKQLQWVAEIINIIEA